MDNTLKQELKLEIQEKNQTLYRMFMIQAHDMIKRLLDLSTETEREGVSRFLSTTFMHRDRNLETTICIHNEKVLEDGIEKPKEKPVTIKFSNGVYSVTRIRTNDSAFNDLLKTINSELSELKDWLSVNELMNNQNLLEFSEYKDLLLQVNVKTRLSTEELKIQSIIESVLPEIDKEVDSIFKNIDKLIEDSSKGFTEEREMTPNQYRYYINRLGNELYFINDRIAKLNFKVATIKQTIKTKLQVTMMALVSAKFTTNTNSKVLAEGLLSEDEIVRNLIEYMYERCKRKQEHAMNYRTGLMANNKNKVNEMQIIGVADYDEPV